MKRYRYSDGNKETREGIYLEELDEIGNDRRPRYIAGGLSVLLITGLIGISGYIAYPFLQGVDKYRSNIEARTDVKRRIILDKEKLDYESNRKNMTNGSKKL